MAWVDAASASTPPVLFPIPQVVSPGEVGSRPTLPSFIYFPTPEEQAAVMALPWDPSPRAIVGVAARDHGGLVPVRQISSAKSWLTNAAVDRSMPLLPWSAEQSPRMSPVEASAAVLAHIRDAWNHTYARDDEGLALPHQAIVLTVPASFDDEARELTVEAARQVGFDRLTLLEEPLAAMYARLQATAGRPHGFTDGQLVLVCDVGGGTTDFSLVRSSAGRDGVQFERIAVGEHLLLGGDNVDLALATLTERRLMAGRSEQARLGVRERQMLRRQCSAAKERLLSDGDVERVTITVLGSGRSIVGGSMTAELSRADVLGVLHEFLPVGSSDDRPRKGIRPGLRELGLPYESDTAITRHLAAFLAAAAKVGAAATSTGSTGDAIARPDVVLFNGGFFTPPIARTLIVDALASWFGRPPAVVTNAAPDAAVAIGAAFFASIRHDPARAGLLIRAESSRSYYIVVQDDQAPGGVAAVCVMSRGAEQGTQVVVDRAFTIVTNQPAVFTLLSSLERTDPTGALVTFAEGEGHRHAPLVTALRFGQRSRRVPLKVSLHAVYTEVGTLELWCEAPATEHRWRLQFNLRSAAPAAGEGDEAEADKTSASQVLIADETVAGAEELIRRCFGANPDVTPEALIGALENGLGHTKHAWPLPVIRRLADVLLAGSDGRRVSPKHEARWLNLAGLCLRPGLGASLDPWRITEMRKVYTEGLAYPKDMQCQVEWLILWQRVCAGFSAGQQQELAGRITGLLGLGSRKAPHLNSQMLREAWRLLASLERLDPAQRARFGDELILKVRREPRNEALLWSIGRLGARAPLYGPLNSVVPATAAERWVSVLLDLKPAGTSVLAVAAQIAARTDDPLRDVSDQLRDTLSARLQAAGGSSEPIQWLQQPAFLDLLAGGRIFGEALPQGLRLDSFESER